MAMVKSPDEFIEELWGYAAEIPMAEHPWFKGIVKHWWTREQIILGETQHYLRVRSNPIYFGYMAINAAAEGLDDIQAVVQENLREEFYGEKSHVDIMLQFLEEAGISREEADAAEPAPGTLACIEMIISCCQRRSALEGLAMLAFVESQHGGEGGAADSIYGELRGHYGFSERATETYQLHAVEDVGHGSRQVDIIRQHATDAETQEKVRRAVKLGVTAFNLEWDGHVQAMTGRREFWPGMKPLSLDLPEVRLPEIAR